MSEDTRESGRGRLTLILGPMFSGKSIFLIAEMDRYLHAGVEFLIVHSKKNIREEDVTTHTDASRPSLKVGLLSELNDRVYSNGVRAIGVDEAFMFDDADDTFNTIRGWLDAGINVVVSSLDVLANGSVPPTVAALLALDPDDVIRREAACKVNRSRSCVPDRAKRTTIFYKGKLVPRDQLDDIVPQDPDDPDTEYKPACIPCYHGQDLIPAA